MVQIVGHGSKMTQKKELAISALLTTSSIEMAARNCGISTNTLRSWLRNNEFLTAFQEAKNAALQLSIATLQAHTGTGSCQDSCRKSCG